MRARVQGVEQTAGSARDARHAPTPPDPGLVPESEEDQAEMALPLVWDWG